MITAHMLGRGGWVVLQILNVLELEAPDVLAKDDSARRLALLDAMRIGHGSRRADPITEYRDYAAEVLQRTSKAAAKQRAGGETTHFSVVDGDGMVVAVTQSIDSYFGARVAHPTLGFLYNNYMQGFQVDDADAPYYLAGREMPLSSMSATVLSRRDRPLLVLGSPGSARIISAVVQVTSHWVDVDAGIAAANAAYRVHVVPEDAAYAEGPELETALLAGMAERGYRLLRPAYGVSDSHLDPISAVCTRWHSRTMRGPGPRTRAGTARSVWRYASRARHQDRGIIATAHERPGPVAAGQVAAVRVAGVSPRAAGARNARDRRFPAALRRRVRRARPPRCSAGSRA